MSPDSPPATGMLARISTALKHFVHPTWDRNQVLASIEESSSPKAEQTPVALDNATATQDMHTGTAIVHDMQPNVLGVQKIVELVGDAPGFQQDLAEQSIREKAHQREEDRRLEEKDREPSREWTTNHGMDPEEEWASGCFLNKNEPWH